MIADRLSIPLNENPARQKFWRAVRFLVLLVGTVILGYLIDRAIHYRSSPQRWPAEANLEIRLIKTPRTIRLVEDGFAHIQALPGAPWSFSEVLHWSKREFVVYANDEQVIGLVVDGDIPAESLASLPDWGWKTVRVGTHTLIIAAASLDPSSVERNYNLWLTLPLFNGSLTLKDVNLETQALPFRLSSATSLDFPVSTKAFIPKSKLILPSETELIGAFSLPAELSTALLPTGVSESFPGLKNLSAQASKQGLDIVLGQDTRGVAFVLSIPSTGLSLEELGEIVTEGAALQNLSTSVLTNNNLPASTEIRNLGDIVVDVGNNDGLAVATAKTVAGDVFRLTQSGNQLIASNREPTIGLTAAKYNGTCMQNPDGFLYPNHLFKTLPGLQNAPDNTLITYLSQAKEVSFRKHWLRICW